jgi:hypothetical protein
MRLTRIVGILMVGYGILHLLGFLTAWDLVEIDVLSRTPTVLPDELHIGVVRDLGLLWLAGMTLFGIAGYGAYTARRWWKGVAFAGAITSLICTILWVHEAWPGILVNLVILGILISDWYRAGPETRFDSAYG